MTQKMILFFMFMGFIAPVSCSDDEMSNDFFAVKFGMRSPLGDDAEKSNKTLGSFNYQADPIFWNKVPALQLWNRLIKTRMLNEFNLPDRTSHKNTPPFKVKVETSGSNQS